MKIQLLSIVAGTKACNARCPFCISKMTPEQGVCMAEPQVNWRNFRKACQLSKIGNVNTAMITSKGEPTLYPHQITKYLEEMKEFEFPIIELQTNAILFHKRREKFLEFLREWYDLGLTTIAISVTHYKEEKNKEIYTPYLKKYIDLPAVIKDLHDIGFSVRLACIMAKGYIDSVNEAKEMIKFAKKNNVEQLTLRPVNKPHKSDSKDEEQWTIKHYLNKKIINEIELYLNKYGHKLKTLIYGGTVFDVDSQNVCLTNSLTLDTNTEDIRQLIFFPDGHLRYDWQYEGAIII